MRWPCNAPHPFRRSAARPPIQMKTRIGPVDDPLEREAARIADAVVANEPLGKQSGVAPQTVQRKCATCEAEEEATLRRKAATGNLTAAHALAPAADAALGAREQRHAALRSGTRLFRATFRARFVRHPAAYPWCRSRGRGFHRRTCLYLGDATSHLPVASTGPTPRRGGI